MNRSQKIIRTSYNRHRGKRIVGCVQGRCGYLSQ